MLKMTPWDVRMALSTVALGVLVFGVACALTGATDEGSIPWATRVLRTLPVIPACGGVVTLLVVRRAERRGEMLALQSIGCSPARAAIFAVVSAAALSIIAAACVLVRSEAASGFYPRATESSTIRVVGDGFVDDAHGIRISRDGALSREPAMEPAPSKADGAWRAITAAIVLASFGFGLALVAARSIPPRVIAWVGFACIGSIVLFQAAAASRVPTLAAGLPAIALLIAAALRYRSPAW